MTLTQHFTREEFTVSQTAARFGLLPNEPDDRQWDLLHELCTDVLEPARKVAGPITVSSGYRSPALNAKLGGARLSDHMILERACAADITAANLGDLFRYIYIQLPWSRLIWEFGQWVHVSYNFEGVREDRSPLFASTEPTGDTTYRRMGFNEIYNLGMEE